MIHAIFITFTYFFRKPFQGKNNNQILRLGVTWSWQWNMHGAKIYYRNIALYISQLIGLIKYRGWPNLSVTIETINILFEKSFFKGNFGMKDVVLKF